MCNQTQSPGSKTTYCHPLLACFAYCSVLLSMLSCTFSWICFTSSAFLFPSWCCTRDLACLQVIHRPQLLLVSRFICGQQKCSFVGLGHSWMAHIFSKSTCIHAIEAPSSPHDCSYKLVGLEWLHREQNQFDVQSLDLEVTHVVFPRGRHPCTPAKEKQ